ncbi:unnamed protein product [Linum trigynum]
MRVINTYDDLVEDATSSDDECDEGDEEGEEEGDLLPFPDAFYQGHPVGSSDHVSTGSTHVSTRVGPLRGKDGRFASSSSGSVSSRKKLVDQTWLLTGAGPGGPSDHSLIPSFGGHISHRLWTLGLDFRVMSEYQFYTRQGGVDRLRLYKFSTPRVENLVRASNLYHLSSCMMHSVDYPLLEAFIERWQPDTNTFHMPFGEMTITLHDVSFLLQIPVDGELLAAPAKGDPSFVSGIVDLLGIPDKNAVAARGIRWYDGGGMLVDEAMTRLHAREDGDAEARCYLMCLIGSTLFVDKSSDRVRGWLYSYFRDLQMVSKYAWGAGALAWMYRQLGRSSRAGSKGFSGCLTLLQAWIYEYFLGA